MSRHGARTPISGDYDPFHTDWGNLLYGQLTPSGMRQHYLIGNQFKRRYNSQNGAIFKLYNPEYNPYEIYVQASNVNRTIVSAYSQLSGLFPPGARSNLTSAQSYNARPPFQIIDSLAGASLDDQVVDLNYQIVPIHTFAKAVDPFRDDWCPEFRYQTNQSKKTPAYIQLQNAFNLTDNSVLPKMARIMNMSRTDMTLQYGKHVRDALMARKFNGLDIGEFAPFFDDIDSMGARWYSFTMTYNKELLKIINTNFFNHTMQFFNRTVQEAITPSQQIDRTRLKFVFLSYHDDQQVELCTGLGINVQENWPPYASTIVQQLWHDDSFDPTTSCKTVDDCLDQFYVKVKYNDVVYPIPKACPSSKTFDQGLACSLREWWEHVKSNVMYQGSREEIEKICSTHVSQQFKQVQEMRQDDVQDTNYQGFLQDQEIEIITQ